MFTFFPSSANNTDGVSDKASAENEQSKEQDNSKCAPICHLCQLTKLRI